MNSSFASGVFPSSLKEGVVHPFFKKPAKDWQDFASYCPVTNIAFLSKLMERVVAIQTLNYLVKEGLLAKMQSAYGQFYSTETALLRVVNDILLSINSRQELILVLLDLSSTIDHSRLLDRLCHRYGFGGTILDYFLSYLTGRYQSVAVKNGVSSSKPLAFGVPQGSVLGQMLFSLYFSPLEEVINRHNIDCMIYADDTQLYLRMQSGEDRATPLAKLV